MSQSASSNAVRNQIAAGELASKYRSKGEIYNLMTLKVKAYLPAYETITIYFLKELIAGTRHCKCRHSTTDSDF